MEVSLIHVPPTANYDPHMSEVDTTLTDFQPVHVLLPEGAVRYFFPSEWVNHHNPQKRDRLIKRGAGLVTGTEAMCKEVEFNTDTLWAMAERVANVAIRIIHLNMLRIMADVGLHELKTNPAIEDALIGVDAGGREIPENKDAADRMAWIYSWTALKRSYGQK